MVTLNPITILKEMMMKLVKIIVFGLMFYVCMRVSNLTNQQTSKNYLMYFIIGSILIYALTILNFMYECHKSDTKTKVSDMNIKGFAKASIFVPIFILIHIICLYLVKTNIIKYDTMEVGMIISFAMWSLVGIVLITGIVYYITFAICQKVTKCVKENKNTNNK